MRHAPMRSKGRQPNTHMHSCLVHVLTRKACLVSLPLDGGLRLRAGRGPRTGRPMARARRTGYPPPRGHRRRVSRTRFPTCRAHYRRAHRRLRWCGAHCRRARWTHSRSSRRRRRAARTRRAQTAYQVARQTARWSQTARWGQTARWSQTVRWSRVERWSQTARWSHQTARQMTRQLARQRAVGRAGRQAR